MQNESEMSEGVWKNKRIPRRCPPFWQPGFSTRSRCVRFLHSGRSWHLPQSKACETCGRAMLARQDLVHPERWPKNLDSNTPRIVAGQMVKVLAQAQLPRFTPCHPKLFKTFPGTRDCNRLPAPHHRGVFGTVRTMHEVLLSWLFFSRHSTGEKKTPIFQSIWSEPSHNKIPS